MPHECTSCERIFADGSTEMLSGCPDCGGNRFQYLPNSAVPESPGTHQAELTDVKPASNGELIEAEADPDYVPEPLDDPSDLFEDGAQTAARSSMIDPSQLPPGQRANSPPQEAPEDDPPEPQRGPPDLGELREELDDRFGSIKIVDRGEYELNLMELFERRECIIELQENGRYVIELPESLVDADA